MCAWTVGRVASALISCELLKGTEAALEQHGLALNLRKCVSQTNRVDARLKPIVVDGHGIPMVSSRRQLNLTASQTDDAASDFGSASS